MAPLVESWSSHELLYRSQIDENGKTRKGFKGDLKGCELLGFVQYECEIERPRVKDSRVICREVERLFRRCQDRNGSFMVETTALEGRNRG